MRHGSSQKKGRSPVHRHARAGSACCSCGHVMKHHAVRQIHHDALAGIRVKRDIFGSLAVAVLKGCDGGIGKGHGHIRDFRLVHREIVKLHCQLLRSFIGSRESILASVCIRSRDVRDNETHRLVVIRIIAVKEVLASSGIGSIVDDLCKVCVIPYLFNRIDPITGAGQRGLDAEGNCGHIAELNEIGRSDIGAEPIVLIVEIFAPCDADILRAAPPRGSPQGRHIEGNGFAGIQSEKVDALLFRSPNENAGYRHSGFPIRHLLTFGLLQKFVHLFSAQSGIILYGLLVP